MSPNSVSGWRPRTCLVIFLSQLTPVDSQFDYFLTAVYVCLLLGPEVVGVKVQILTTPPMGNNDVLLVQIKLQAFSLIAAACSEGAS